MDSRTKSDLQRLTKKRTTIAPLGGVSAPDSIPAQTGTGSPGGVSVISGGSGFNELTEDSRTYYGNQSITSSDGLFTFTYANVQTINFIDDAGNAKTMNLDNV